MLIYEAVGGQEIAHAILTAINYSRRIGEPVEIRFNNWRSAVTSSDTVDGKVAEWEASRTKLRNKDEKLDATAD